MNRLVYQPIPQTAMLADLDRYASAVESSVGAAGTMSAAGVPHSPWGESIQSLGITLDMPVRELWAGQSQGGGGPLPAYEIGRKLTARPLTKPAASASGNAPAPKPEPKFPGREGDFGDYVEWADFYRNLKAKFPGIDANFDEIKKYARDLLIEQGLKYLGDELKDYASDTLADWLSDSMTNAVSTAAASTAGGMMDGIIGKIDEAFGKIGDLIQNPSKILDLAVAEGLPKLLDKGIDALFGIDADDSPGAVVGKYFGKMIVEGMVDALMAGVQNLDQLIANFQDLQSRLKSMLDQFFNGTPGKAILPVARVDDKDDKVDVVLGHLPTVIARGQPVARATDLMTPSNKPITEGSATVFAGGLPLSRLTSATAIPSAIAKGEPTVLVGGPTKVIPPPPPPVTPPKGGGGGAPAKAAGPAGESGKTPQQTKADPKANQKPKTETKSPEGDGKTAPAEEPRPEDPKSAEADKSAEEHKPIVVGIEGTGSKEYRDDPGATTQHVENIVNDYDTDPEKKIVLDGPRSEGKYLPGGVVGAVDTLYPTDPQRIEDEAYNRIKEQLQRDPEAPIDMYGHSRGGHIALNLAERLKTEGVVVEIDGRPTTIHPTVRYMGLYDPVDMSVGYGNGDKIPSNVERFAVVKAAESDPYYFYFDDDKYTQSRSYFRRPDLVVENPTTTKGETFHVTGTHAAIGGAPGRGDHPSGYSYERDVANSINSDQLIRDRAIQAGAPIQQKPRSDYQNPPELPPPPPTPPPPAAPLFRPIQDPMKPWKPPPEI